MTRLRRALATLAASAWQGRAVRSSLGLLAVAAFLQSPAPGLEGTWRGTLATGAANLRLVLTVARAADGLYTGSLESLDQGSTIPINKITVTGDAVLVDVPAVSGTFQGTLNATRTELKGTWTQGGPLPLTFTRSAPATPAAPSAPAPSPPTFPLGLPLDLSVPMPPTPFLANDGDRYLVYELHIGNFGPRELLLARVDVLANKTAIATYAENDLNAVLSQPGTPPSTDRRSLGAGKRAVVFIWIKLGVAQSIPADLRHRITVGEVTIEDEGVQVSKQSPVEIGAPLRGDGWLAGNGPSRDSGHRRALIATEGRARIAQRFAIDWVQVNADGRTFTGDVKDNKSYRAYRSEILAVADAVVAATKDGIPENVPGATSRAVPITSETIGGNHIVLDLGNGRFAFYAHLQPGSLRVKVGDRVKRGQVIGLVGNSGNSTEPHLHFHVSSGVSPLGSEGLPYILAGTAGMPLQNSRISFK